MMEKKVYRSRRGHIIAGVAGGIGDFFGIDATLMRLSMLLALRRRGGD
ncbi:MAG: PspC domain-containing protein [Limnochordia bacterium]|jgi:phage shock protein C